MEKIDEDLSSKEANTRTDLQAARELLSYATNELCDFLAGSAYCK